MKYLIIMFFVSISTLFVAQIPVKLMYKAQKCGGRRNPDTTSYFLLANRKFIVQYSRNKTTKIKKTDTLYTDINGKITIPNKRGTYYIYEAWKYYHLFPSDYPKNLYHSQCIEQLWRTPDFVVKLYSSKNYTITPQYIFVYCPDKHPCLRTDTIIPRIPKQ